MESWDIRTLEVKPHFPQVLHSTPDARMITLQLPGGEELQEHHTRERAYLVVVDGEVDIVQDGSTTSGGPGLVLHFEPLEDREVRARTDARLVMVFAPWPAEGHHT